MRIGPVDPASMGPRSTDRGNGRLQHRFWIYPRASMGPRSTDRGNEVVPPVGVSLIALQWGRDRLIAEIQVIGTEQGDQSALQWGRDRLIAEMTTRASSAATASLLQWGRDRLIAEMPQSAPLTPTPT